MRYSLGLGGGILAGAILVFTASGCIATRSWVDNKIDPLTDQIGRQESQLHDTDAKADRALTELQNLHLERRLVLDSQHGPNFAFGSAALTGQAKRAIDSFVQDLPQSAGSESGRLFVVAGYTDNVGTEDYNYELGQRRAERVAGYLVDKEGVDPMQIRAVSYGASKPIASNRTLRGRRDNRRVEILVYQEKIATGS
ncbi:MAG TPA: OmpA family protein [Candidatus Binataceae bacterium]|nr:OmpA family protein [Candidatus Binataceae bacterium]